jgi:hypothetical protein
MRALPSQLMWCAPLMPLLWSTGTGIQKVRLSNLPHPSQAQLGRHRSTYSVLRPYSTTPLKIACPVGYHLPRVCNMEESAVYIHSYTPGQMKLSLCPAHSHHCCPLTASSKGQSIIDHRKFFLERYIGSLI